MLLQVPVALGFGLAALWLLAPYLGRSHRFRTFLGILAVLVVSVVFSFAATVGWGLGLEPIASLLDPRHCAATANVGVMALPFLVPLVLPAPGLAAAMVLCGLACGGAIVRSGSACGFSCPCWQSGLRCRRCSMVLWRIASPGSVGYAPFLGIGLLMVAVTFATLLPFLILSSASPFFRERLKALLHVKPEAPAAVAARREEGPGLPFDRSGTGVDTVPGC